MTDSEPPRKQTRYAFLNPLPRQANLLLEMRRPMGKIGEMRL